MRYTACFKLTNKYFKFILDIAIKKFQNMYKTSKNTHDFCILTVNINNLVLTCKFIDNNRGAKRFAQRTEEIEISYSYHRQFSLKSGHAVRAIVLEHFVKIILQQQATV